MPSVLEELLELLEEELADAKNIVGDRIDPLVDPELSQVAVCLTNAEQHIADALNEISNAGVPDTNNLPSTLPAIANECLILARDARTEAMRSNRDRKSV